MGGAFTSFTCSCCGYSPTEAQWRADLAAYHLKTDEEQKMAVSEHMDGNDEENSHKKHYHQVLFMPPLPHHGMDRAGVDQLHLIYLNIFKHLFKYTIHEGLPDSKKMMVREYLKERGFYSYDAASDTEDPVKHWIGREVKRFIDEGHMHLPFLLQLAAAPADCCPEMEACANADGEQEMDDDDEYAPTAADIAEEEKEEPLMMSNAGRWDHFLALARGSQAPWPQGDLDTDEYRQGRAVSAFNLGAIVANDILTLKPTFLTWTLHILCFIVPRQLVALGDASRRSCDACESFGAMVKKLIKHSTCRRRVSARDEQGHAIPSEHVDGKSALQSKLDIEVKSARRWKQTFTVGYIQQAFTRTCVRESLRHGESNVPWLLRDDYARTSTGLAGRSKLPKEGPFRSIKSAMEYQMQNAPAPAPAP